MQTTEQLAPATIAELLAHITDLTKMLPFEPGAPEGTVLEGLPWLLEAPTTANLEDALKASKALTRALFEWLASRYFFTAQSKAALNPGLQALRSVAGEFTGIPVETAAEAEELDRIEAAHPAPIFAPVNMADLAMNALGISKGA